MVLGVLFVALSAAPAFAESRTLDLYFTHTRERLKVVYKRNGSYVPSELRKINHFLRDWRRNESTRMDPELLDLLWDVQQEFGGRTIHVVSAYRSPATNRMLRQRSRGVAKQSQHMAGRAIDFFIEGVSVSDLRKAGIKRQVGGVGFYPRSGSPFVHFDTGSVRAWPRMSRSELARIFPDGTTLHIPSDGKPLAGYARARELESKGQLASLGGGSGRTLFGFGGLGRRSTTTVAANDRPGDRVLPGGTGGSAAERGPDLAPQDEPIRVQTASLGPSATDSGDDEERRGFIQLPSVSLGGLIDRFRDDEEAEDEASEGAEAAEPEVRPVETPAQPLTAVAVETAEDAAERVASGPVPVPRMAPRRAGDPGAVAEDADAPATTGAADEVQLAALPPSRPGERASEPEGTALAYARPDGTLDDTGSPLGATAALIPGSAVTQPIQPMPRRPEPRLAALVATRSAADEMLTPVRGASPALIADASGVDESAFATLTAPDRRRAAEGGLLTAQGFLGAPSQLATGRSNWLDTKRFTGVRITVYARPRP